MDVGFCGLGAMGAAMAARLLDRGHRVTVWNRTAAKAQPLLERGAVWAASPQETTSGGRIVLSCLYDDAAIRDVYEGAGGLLAAAGSGSLFVDMSTVGAPTLQDVARGAAAKGAALIECPVAGAPMMARDGGLMGFLGGAAADVERARPLLADLCQRLEHCGPLGSGNAVKLAVNLPLIAYFETLGEALAIAREVPVDPQTLVALLADSPGGANVMKFAAPWIAEALASGREAGGVITLAAVRKDLHLMLDAAGRLGASLPVTGVTLAAYDAAVADGWGERPFWTLALHRRGRAPGG